LGLFTSCNTGDDKNGGSRAYRVEQRKNLIGGPMAMGDIGDFMLENNQIRVVISKAGISRAFGLFGGTLIDADRVRAGMGLGDSSGGNGFDSLVEMFPLFFLGVVDPKTSEVIQDGRDGGSAIVRVTGEGSSFIALTEQINNIITFPGGRNRLHFALDYILHPGKNYIELKVTATNTGRCSDNTTHCVQNSDCQGIGEGICTPPAMYQFGGGFGEFVPSVTGMVGLFGKRNTVFIPGIAGYNIRFSLEEVFKQRLQVPAIPGLVGDFVATRGEGGVSYGIIAQASEDNYVYKNRTEFQKLGVPVTTSSVMVPIEGSSITGCFTKQVKTRLRSGPTDEDPDAHRFTHTVYIVIGDGSVSSIRDLQLELHKREKGKLTGQVLQELTYNPLPNARILAYTGEGTKPGDRIFYSEFVTDSNGKFQGYLEPGNYKLIAILDHNRSAIQEIEIKKDQTTNTTITLPRNGYINVTIRDQDGRLLPSKVTITSTIGKFESGRCVGKAPIGCLYDLHIGESKIDTDFRVGLSCADQKSCFAHGDCKGIGDQKCEYRMTAETEYREAFTYAPKGQAQLKVRPGNYKVTASRGIEYELGIADNIEAKAGHINEISLIVKHSVSTPNAISADLHVHTNYSHDAKLSDQSRVESYAGEGVDYFVTTDHNRIRDIQPIVEAMGLERWLKTGIGVELTTFEMGHFNAFPLKYDHTQFHGGNPDWFKKETRYTEDIAFPAHEIKRPLRGLREGISPGEIFASLRELGNLCESDPKCAKTIIQINHPRDTILGYFSVFNMDSDTGLPLYTSGITQPISREFDADQFSFDFDAIEFFNGSRLDLLWHWRFPPNFKTLPGYDAAPNRVVRIDNNGRAEVAYPGGGDDWFNLLNQGRAYTGTANSDSHDHDPEAGYPRNYLWLDFDEPWKMTDQVLSQVILDKKVLMTNGPIVEFFAQADGQGEFLPIGSTINASSTVTLRIKVRAASWIDTSEIIIFKNGRILKTITISKTTDIVRYSEDIPGIDISGGDAWFVVSVKGNGDMWPVVRSDEIPPFQISEAVSLLQDSLLQGISSLITMGQASCILPAQVRRVTPYAITNPIWISTKGNNKYTPDQCRTLGERGIRCTTKDSKCENGLCLRESQTCTNDRECGYFPNQPLPRCIGGKCVVDPCKDISCARTFVACSEDKPCPNDACPKQDKVCADGTSCSQDLECKGKGDELCRYCKCPPARNSCPNGAACNANSDCKDAAPCEPKRFCYPTACALGYCEPIYAVCSDADAQRSSHLFLRTSQSEQNKSTQSQNYRTPSISNKTDTQGLSINNVRSLFLFFEHKH
jgi:hypothetical protein